MHNWLVFRCVTLLLSLCSMPSLAATFSLDGYSPRSLTSWDTSIRDSTLFPKSDRDEAFDPSLTPLSSSVQYTGRSRPLSLEKKRFLKELQAELAGGTDLGRAYTREVLVRENGFPFWIAVQDKVFPCLGAELHPGEGFVVYWRFGGVARHREPVYLLVEFDSAVARNAVGSAAVPILKR